MYVFSRLSNTGTVKAAGSGKESERCLEIIRTAKIKAFPNANPHTKSTGHLLSSTSQLLKGEGSRK